MMRVMYIEEIIIMKTMIFDSCNNIIDSVCKLLIDNKVGAIPCDTIYGFSGIANEITKDYIFEIKQRPQSKNLITLMSLDELKKSSLIVPPILYDIYPAPLTAILRDEDSGNTVAVRVPNDSFIGEIIKKVGPIWSTSVNISGQPSLTTFDEILAVFDSKVDFIVKKNIGSNGLPSTLVDFSSSEIKILRQGSFDIKPYLI